MLLEEYTFENALEAEREEAYEEGIEIGFEKGREERDKYFLELLEQDLSKEEIKRKLGERR